MFQENILWFKIAMYQLVFIEQVQTLQNGIGKLSDQWQAEALELVLLDQLIQVDAE